MFGYQLALALRSMRRNPILTLVMVGGIATGIGVAMIFVTAQYVFASNPIPEKSGRLYYVQMDAWNPERPVFPDRPEEPPDQLTYLEAMAIVESGIPTYGTASYTSSMTIHPPEKGARPYREDVRLCFSDFFHLFEPPFLFGNGWDRKADQGPEPVVVLNARTNDRLFGGENSVGRTLRIEDREFTVVGVLDDWHPVPRYYDTHGNELGQPEEFYMPFHFSKEMEAYSSGSTWSWTARDPGYEGLMASETLWLQAWVQLDTPQQKEEFQAWMDAYVLEQKKLGRFGRPLNNKVRNVMEWLAYQEVVPEEATALLVIALLFLLVCSVNLIGILLGKFLGRAPEVGIRRALGASRRSVFLQHLLECQIIGLVGAMVGMGLARLGLIWVINLFEGEFIFPFDWNLYMMACGLALVSALIAGTYPAWRICRISPGVYLKAQ